MSKCFVVPKQGTSFSAIQKSKFLSYMWSSFQASFPQSFEEKRLFNIFIFVRDTHKSSITESAYCVTAMLLDLNELHISKWPASYSSELHLALSTVAALPQLSWGIHCLEALAFSDLESGCQSKILVHPDESGKRHEMSNNVRQFILGLNAIQTHAHLDEGLMFDAFSS